MQNYRFDLQYDGTRYKGWQRQGNTAQTVQAKLEEVLGLMVGHKIEVHGAGRTDAGVHARGQVASCKMQTERSAGEIAAYCNRYLPEDIAVTGCTEVSERFHARLGAKSKRYVYRLWTGPYSNVFERKFLCAWPHSLDIEKMRLAAALLEGTHDFRSFQSNKRLKKSTVRTMHSIEVCQTQNEVTISYHGSGFLYNMVRILTGTLVEVGMGERIPESMPEIIAAKDRMLAGQTMPPQGLILDEIVYGE